MRRLDILEEKINKRKNNTDKLNILVPNGRNNIDIWDNCIKNAFIELYAAIPKNQLNLLILWSDAIKNPTKIKKFLKRKDVQKYIIWDKDKLCYKLDLRANLNITDEIIQSAFKALYPAIEEFEKYDKEGKCIMDPKNKEMNDLFRQAAGINTNEENINDNNDKENQNNDDKNKNKNTKNSNKFMNDQIRGAANGKHGLVDKKYANFSVDMDKIDEMINKAVDKKIGGK
jgi:hypothetical protein